MDVDVASFEVYERVIVRDLFGCMYNTRARLWRLPRLEGVVQLNTGWIGHFVLNINCLIDTGNTNSAFRE